MLGSDADGAPPLYAVGAATPPEGAQAFWLNTSDGKRLRAAYWKAQAPVRGAVALFQGRTEFIEKFYEPVQHLLERGFSVLTFDWRGQGLSDRPLPDRRKGYVRDFLEFQNDVDAALAALAEREPNVPWFLVAHSMGGAVAARTLMRQSRGGGKQGALPGPGFQAAILSAPMLGLAGAGGGSLGWSVASAMTNLGGGGVYSMGGSSKPFSEEGYDDNPLTSDPQRYEDRYAAIIRAHPEVALGGATWAWLNAARREMTRIKSVDLPMLVVIGDNERIVTPSAVQAYAKGNPNATLLTLKGDVRHEPFLENDKAQTQLWAAVSGFLNRFTPPRLQAASQPQ